MQLPENHGLFGDVTIPVLLEGAWRDIAVKDLSLHKGQFVILAWTGRSFKQVEAHTCLPLGPSHSLIKIELQNKKRLILSGGCSLPEANPKFASEKIPSSVGLLSSKAETLKTGLSLVSCGESGIEKAHHNIAGIQRLYPLKIAKIKSYKCEEPEMVYNLSVPNYKNVLLSCGALFITN